MVWRGARPGAGAGSALKQEVSGAVQKGQEPSPRLTASRHRLPACGGGSQINILGAVVRKALDCVASHTCEFSSLMVRSRHQLSGPPVTGDQLTGMAFSLLLPGAAKVTFQRSVLASKAFHSRGEIERELMFGDIINCVNN